MRHRLAQPLAQALGHSLTRATLMLGLAGAPHRWASIGGGGPFGSGFPGSPASYIEAARERRAAFAPVGMASQSSVAICRRQKDRWVWY